MPTFSLAEIRDIGKSRILTKKANQVLNETVSKQTQKNYDIFLSHAFKDADLILGVYLHLLKYGYSVYVDWIDDPALNRSFVTKATAEKLRDRMKCCKCLLYAVTENSCDSKWMPWECGYLDGLKESVAIFPVTTTPSPTFVGQEYLGCYPFITKASRDTDHQFCLWVNWESNNYVDFDGWLQGKKPCKH